MRRCDTVASSSKTLLLTLLIAKLSGDRMSKLAITVVSIALLSASGLARAGGHEDPQAKIEQLQQEKTFLLRRLDRAKAFSREKIANLEMQLDMQKQDSAKERQTLLRRIDRAKAYSRENLANQLAMQKQESGKERQQLLRRLDRAKAYSKQNLANQLAMQKQESGKERQQLLRRIDRAKNYSRNKINSLENAQVGWADNVGASLNAAFGGLDGTLVTTNNDNSVTVQVGNNGLFNTGSTIISAAGSDLLSTIAAELASTDGNITVVGHTDNVPVGASNRFANNEELSFSRAMSTLQFFRDQGIPIQRLAAAGYGAANPIAGNDTADGRRQNRRVEIILRK